MMRALRFTFVRCLIACCLACGSQIANADDGRIPDTMAQRMLACVACHGKEGRAASDGYYPRIAGKPAGYLYNQLRNFRNGRRSYPVMNAMLENMPDAYLREIADYFSQQHPPYPAPQAAQAQPTELERGRLLIHEGDKAKGIPACIACHGQALSGTLPAIPGLIGLPRDYLLGQIGAWRIGSRRAAAPDCMASIVQKMSDADISAATAWLAAQAVPAEAVPAAGNIRLPLRCGSVAQ